MYAWHQDLAPRYRADGSFGQSLYTCDFDGNKVSCWTTRIILYDTQNLICTETSICGLTVTYVLHCILNFKCICNSIVTCWMDSSDGTRRKEGGAETQDNWIPKGNPLWSWQWWTLVSMVYMHPNSVLMQKVGCHGISYHKLKFPPPPLPSSFTDSAILLYVCFVLPRTRRRACTTHTQENKKNNWSYK